MSVAEGIEYAPLPPPDTRIHRLRRWLNEYRPEFQVGTLRYTGRRLLWVFAWLLIGDFCLQLLDTNIPDILPLKMKHLGAGDTSIAVVNTTIARTVVFLLAPIVSVWSDRTRTRWGRRIPYLLWSAPFVGLFLVLIGHYEGLTNLLAGDSAQFSILGMTIGRTPLTLLVLGGLVIGWDFANIFVNTVYYYLFNDVVPAKYLSRFMALFRIVYLLSALGYSRWILPHSLTHFRWLFTLAGVGYAIGFFLMCIFVREGEYPPPPAEHRREGFFAGVATYARECFTHRIYWYFFIANTCTYTSRLTGTFLLIRSTASLGLSLDQWSWYKQLEIGIALLLTFPAGWLADKWHPLRVYLLASIWVLLGTLSQCVWIVHDFGISGNLFYLYLTGLSFMPLRLIAEAAELPMYMRILPKDRYGQFCSANGMVRAFAMIPGSVLAGMFISSMEPWFGERRYTWMAGWQFVFQVAAAGFLILLYREWKRHGGDECYQPPLSTFPCNT